MPRAVFVFGANDLNVEESVAKAERFLEPVDVDGGEYQVIYEETGAVCAPL